jgi:hypothetical protein
VLQYLMDKRSDLMDSWAEGGIAPERSAGFAMAAITYKDIAELDFKTIEEFYSK